MKELQCSEQHASAYMAAVPMIHSGLFFIFF